MATLKWSGRQRLPLWLGLAVSLVWLAGCGLCTKHLYLYREAPQKLAPAEVALLIADPNLVQAVMPGANLSGVRWAPEQMSYETEAYLLTMNTVDGKTIYQGMCLDTNPTYAVEVRPGTRRVGVRVDLFGPEGQEKFTEVVQLNLQPGQAYFLRPDWQELLSKRLVVKAEPMPEAYTPLLRARVIDRQRQTNRSASID